MFYVHECIPEGAGESTAGQRWLQDGTEELLLPEGVLRRRHGGEQGILFSMGFAVRCQICCCFGDLYPVNVGLHLELLHLFASLSNASSVVGGHEAAGSGLLHLLLTLFAFCLFCWPSKVSWPPLVCLQPLLDVFIIFNDTRAV